LQGGIYWVEHELRLAKRQVALNGAYPAVAAEFASRSYTLELDVAHVHEFNLRMDAISLR
jgi:hypothetical protein